MTLLRSLPREVRWTVPLALLALAAAVPFSAPDGTGMQWDEIVLGLVAASSAWTMVRLTRAMTPRAARPWRFMTVGILMFMTGQFLAGFFPGPEFDGFGGDDVLLLAGACTPLITCGLLARRVSRTRWTALVVDGLVITIALLTVTEVLRAPLVNPVNAPDDLRSLVLAYGGYAAIMLGGAGALCTVSTAALRRSVSVMIGAVAWQASAACFEAMAIIAPSWTWVAGSDLSVAMGLQTVVIAAAFAPRTFAERSARASAPVVSPLGMALVIGAVLSLPGAIVLMEVRDEGHSVAAEIGFALVFSLMALRLVLRVREDGRITEDLVRSEQDFRGLIESSSDGIAIMDGEFRLMFASPAARRLLGLSADDDEVSLLDLVDPSDREQVRQAGSLPAGDGPAVHFRVRTADGSSRDLEATSTERPGSDRRVLYLRDVTKRRRRERELERMAYTDHLTGLPNRASLFGEMAAPTLDERCLLVLDLDGFKAVNDVAGHEAGDHLLVEVARRLGTVVREDDLVARLGGDEFAVLVTGSLAEAEDVAQRVVDALGMPHRTSEWAFAVGASVGVAELTPAGGQVAFREADAALRAAKQAGKGCVRLAAGTAGHPIVVVPDSDLDAVVDEGVLQLRLDTACDADGRIVLVHAVPVWQHAVHGTVRGMELWTVAERQGRSAALQRWLLRQACLEIAGLDDSVGVAVSLPAGHAVPEGLAAEIADALREAGLHPSRLTISFTEETLLTSSAALVPELEAARATGVRLCLDNYGMGHSLFALLARISLDMVRVDLAALATRDDTGRAQQVLTAIVRTTTSFNLLTIAGGVHTPEVRRTVLAAGVALMHGRLQPHDLPVEALAALLPLPSPTSR
ncbi:diguanylate cyclase domain-containing protein [Blastococcus sp. PRF04-17]|uniref:diguanylate cyclase domain-containing protein n=1 Tax=Blastococcus sp. PRF04-17 TaxID=2933797 RepID=UPI001FF2A1DD|nr:diguanylate cyclase [Blastococcus sp. PRF04-17]UOY00239.1 diguanylate cyclase [Blastococcus sp. PRF04-17]